MRCKSSVVACRNFGSAQVSKKGRGTEGCIAGSTEQATFFRKAHVQLPCDMVRGALGLLGVKEATDVTLQSYKEYTPSWAKVGTVGDDWAGSKQEIRFEQCGTNLTTIPSGREPPYCDGDGDPATSSSVYSWVNADAVLAYAHAMHNLQQYGSSDDVDSPAALYEAVLALPDSLKGVSGSIILGPEGDRQGSFEILNLQLQQAGRRLAGAHGAEGTPLSDAEGEGAEEEAGRRLFVSLETLRAEFVTVGSYEPARTGTAESISISGNVVYHGGETTAPPDEVAIPTCGSSGDYPEAEYFYANVSESCEAATTQSLGFAHTLVFDWRTTPPGASCALPYDTEIACEYVPHSDSSAIALSAIGLGVPLLVFGALLVCSASHAIAERRRSRSTLCRCCAPQTAS